MKTSHIIKTLALYFSFVSCYNYSNSTFGMQSGNRKPGPSKRNTNILAEEQNSTQKIDFEYCNSQNVASLIVGSSDRNYFVRSSANDKLFIKFKTSLVANPDKLTEQEVDILSDTVEEFTVVMNKMFDDKKFIFCIKHYLYGSQSENYKLVKFELNSVLVKYVEVEKKFWKKMGDSVFEEIDIYANIPVITRLPLGICPLNPKKLMSDSHILLFMPAVVQGGFITLDRLYSLVKSTLVGLKMKREKGLEGIKRVDNDDVFPAELTLESINSKRDAEFFASVGSTQREVKKFNLEKRITNEDNLSLAPGIDEGNIGCIASEYLLNNANNWVLVNLELMDLASVPKNYRSPSLVEAICMMLYALENDLELILENGIATDRQAEKVDSIYFVEYLKKNNSISISSKQKGLVQKSFVLRAWDKGEDVMKKSGQSAFVYPDYLCQICMCPAYCCHDSALLKNPFCSSNFGIQGLCKRCLVCPAIDDCCIYPTSESFCKRCEDISCEKHCGCIAFNCLAYSCFAGGLCGVCCGFIF